MNLRQTQVLLWVPLVLAITALIIWQYHERERLASETAALRSQTNQLAQAEARLQHLQDELKATPVAPNAEHEELLRLRGEVGILLGVQQEHAHLKAERDKLAQQLQKEADARKTAEE